eukprot:GHVN01090653.1.p1 GENE.GHVN01090653.1~~GHVN01090653.1.p1  ORF type:complete len:234 (-),score=13.37 GHVN01090653.1:25-726(-)
MHEIEEHTPHYKKTLQPDVKTYLAKVYALVFYGLLLFGGTAYGFILLIRKYKDSLAPIYWSVFIGGLVIGIGGAFVIIYSDKSKTALRFIAYSLVAAIFGAMASFLLEAAAEVDPSIIPMAIGTTMFVVIGLTVLSFIITRKTIFYLSGLIMIMFPIIILASFMNFIIMSKNFEIALTSLFVFIFSCLILIYTKFIIDEKEEGRDDPILHAYLLFTAIVNLFLELVKLKLLTR